VSLCVCVSVCFLFPFLGSGREAGWVGEGAESNAICGAMIAATRQKPPIFSFIFKVKSNLIRLFLFVLFQVNHNFLSNIIFYVLLIFYFKIFLFISNI